MSKDPTSLINLLASLVESQNVHDLSSAQLGHVTDILETHLTTNFDKLGCFAFVGWAPETPPPAPSASATPHHGRFDDQRHIAQAFALAAVRHGVFCGALEPDEGFGLAVWLDKGLKPDSSNNPKSGTKLLKKIQGTVKDAYEIIRSQTGKTSLMKKVRVVVHFGHLRGTPPLNEASGCYAECPTALAGHLVIQQLYGTLPNDCGSRAKGKASGQHKPPALNTNRILVLRDRYFAFSTASLRWGTSGAGQREEILELPQSTPATEAKVILVGLSLDLANNSKAARKYPHRSKIAADEIFANFSDLTATLKTMFVSPRYGDGLTALIVLECRSVKAALRPKSKWHKALTTFCTKTSRKLKKVSPLGMRLGVAAVEDVQGKFTGLLGAARVDCAVVSFAGQEVLQRAHSAQARAKQREGSLEGRVALSVEIGGSDKVTVFQNGSLG